MIAALLVTAAIQATPMTASDLYRHCLAYDDTCAAFMVQVRSGLTGVCESSQPTPSMYGEWLVLAVDRRRFDPTKVTAEEAAEIALRDYLECAPRAMARPQSVPPNGYPGARRRMIPIPLPIPFPR